jgi:hypothetical protein
VAALSENTSAKSIVENDLAAKLQQEGVQVSKSIDLFPPRVSDSENDKEELMNRIRNDGVDAILTLSLIDEETETRYVPGGYGYAPYPRYPYYGRFWGYYDFWYPQLYQPGYYTEDKVYYIEANLYDTETENLIWSAQSETYNPSNLHSFSREFVDVITRRMKVDQVLM